MMLFKIKKFSLSSSPRISQLLYPVHALIKSFEWASNDARITTELSLRTFNEAPSVLGGTTGPG